MIKYIQINEFADTIKINTQEHSDQIIVLDSVVDGIFYLSYITYDMNKMLITVSKFDGFPYN